jgi:AbrB family looped-hinge helix DNA binding protein
MKHNSAILVVMVMALGFGERPQSAYGFGDGVKAAAGGSAVVRGKLKIGPGGRVVIPASMREALGVEEGQVLVATLENGELRLVSMATALDAARAMVRSSIPQGANLADELIADRRKEAERENRD